MYGNYTVRNIKQLHNKYCFIEISVFIKEKYLVTFYLPISKYLVTYLFTYLKIFSNLFIYPFGKYLINYLFTYLEIFSNLLTEKYLYYKIIISKSFKYSKYYETKKYTC